jgi:hypothetical protein
MWRCVLFTGQDMIPARNAIEAHAQYVMAIDELLLPTPLQL